MGGKTALLYSQKFLDYNLGPSHPLRPIRVKLTHDLIQAKGLLTEEIVQIKSPRLASKDEILLFHESDYIRLVQKYSEKGAGLLDAGDTPAFKGCFEATSLVVGAAGGLRSDHEQRFRSRFQPFRRSPPCTPGSRLRLLHIQRSSREHPVSKEEIWYEEDRLS